MQKPPKPSRSHAGNRPARKPRPRLERAALPESHALWDEEDAQGPEKLQKIAGLQAVSALFRQAPERVERLYYGAEMKRAAGPLCSVMAKLHKPYRLLEEDELVKVAGTPLHGGIVAAAQPRDVLPIEFSTLARWAEAKKPLLILDGVGNPNNLGAIARTMAFFGLEHLLLSDHPEQAGLSDSAYRVAEGGLEHLQIGRVPNLPIALPSLRKYYRVIGTAISPTAQSLGGLPPDRHRPVALVLGNEQNGLNRHVMAACEAIITVHGKGQIQSLNVAATAAILIHELSQSAEKKSAANKKVGGHSQRVRALSQKRVRDR